jgi:hypothetical protein
MLIINSKTRYVKSENASFEEEDEKEFEQFKQSKSELTLPDSKT